MFTKYQRMYFYTFDSKVAKIIFHMKVIMMIQTIHVSVVQLNVLCWLTWITLWTKLLSVWTAFLRFNFYWHFLQFYWLTKQWPPSLSWHPDMICKPPRSFKQIYEYHLEDISYLLKLTNCSMFYKPVSPSITGQM